MTINVVQVVPRIAAASSGPSVSVPNLCSSLSETRVATRLMALEPVPSNFIFEQTEFFPAAKLRWASRLGVSSAMRYALHVAATQSDIIHTNSLWMMPNIYPERAVRGTSCALMVSPRGTLSPWALNRSRIRKWFVWRMGQKRVMSAADCIHATSHDELEAVRTLGFRNPVAVVSNGVSCPVLPAPAIGHKRSSRTLLFLARIHPTKGVDVLLRAWRIVQSRFPDWNLKIAGPLGSDYSSQMLQLSRELQLQRVEFVGELTGQAKAQTYFQADLYVLPSHSENFGISVAEALAHGVPSIVFHGAPWSKLDDHRAGWWIPNSVDSLGDTLRHAMDLSDHKRQEMGRNGHNWMQAEYDWKIIGQRMVAVYRWVKQGGAVPADVYTD